MSTELEAVYARHGRPSAPTEMPLEALLLQLLFAIHSKCQLLKAVNPKATGEEVLSFTILTINADSHPVFNQFHRPEDEKRMVVILREDQYDEWLDAPAARSMALMQPYPAQLLMATQEPERGRRKA